MTKEPEEDRIRQLHAEFSGQGKYRDRLSLYNTVFGLISYEFPRFDPNLDMLFKPEKTGVIDDLLERERRNSFIPEKKFVFPDGTFVFNVAPLNSNAEIFNDFIITTFMDADVEFGNMMTRIANGNDGDLALMQKMHAKAAKNIRLIEEKIYSGNETSWRNQFMTVFYHGYVDHRNHIFKKFPRRKKIIELYLYSHGMLYAKYVDALYRFVTDRADPQVQQPAIPDIRTRLALFTELGIISLLRNKYRNLEESVAEMKVAGVLCVMLGENAILSEQVLDYLRTDAQAADA
jgi:hypothetical protein